MAHSYLHIVVSVVVSLKKTSQFVFFGERVLSRPSSGRIHMLPSLFLKGLCETVLCWNYETRTTTNFSEKPPS